MKIIYPYGSKDEDIFVTSLTFEMEPYFYEQLNELSETIWYQEFGSFDLENIQKIRTLIGKRFYAVPYKDEEDEEEYYNMIIE